MNADAHILVVDDNENNRFMLLQHLRKLGFRRISEANDGATALRIIRETPPDLVLLDVIMPDTDGISVLEALRREGHLGHVPVVMVSAHDNLEIVVRCIELGAEDYLTKPIHMQMLRARIAAILEKRRLRELELEILTHFDPDTRLPNRRALLERVDRLLASGRQFALVALTCRDHGSIALGAGEDDASRRLRTLNDRIQRSSLPTDIVARVADGTLGWLVPDVQPDHLLLRAVEAVLGPDPLGASSAADAGDARIDPAHDCIAAIAIGPPADPQEGAAEMLRLAMSELMRISPDGNERVLIADPAWRIAAREALALLRQVEQALTREELTLHFQPIFDVADGRLTGAEALLRWHHPARGLLGPGAFLPAVEHSPLMDVIDAWVVTTATAALARWAAGLPEHFRLHVNVTAHALVAGLVTELVDRAVPTNIRRHLTIELTERIHVVDMPACVDALQQLRSRGIQVALDDFGTGFSSLSHISLLPCDLLKIDRSFVTDVDGSPKRRLLLAALVGMARALDLGVVVEGMEREEELATLRPMAPLQVQGYLLGRPMPEADLLALLAGNP
jgi:EAL domain-containing protein (putative c-di-GMP-specific phosphodiesterase class I)/DNA-binding response OmpR family regulator